MNFKVALLGSTLGLLLGYLYAASVSEQKLVIREMAPSNGENNAKNITEPSNTQVPTVVESPSTDETSFLLDNAESIVAYLGQQISSNTNYSAYSDSRLKDLLSQQPNIAAQLFSKLSELERGGVRDELIKLIVTRWSAARPLLASTLLKKLQSGEKFEEWLKMGNELYLSSEPLTIFLTEKLTYSNNVEVIDSSINLLIRGVDMTPHMASPRQRKNIIDTINQFRNHENPAVRASVINSYYKFPPANLETELFAAMQDSSPRVRSVAMNIASRRLNDSNQLKDYMLSILNNPNSHHMERLNVSLSLQNMYLDASETILVKNITEELDRHAATLTYEEDQQLADEYYNSD